MTAVLLHDLDQRISQQETQLQALRRDLESRRQQLTELCRHKEELLAQLREIDAQMTTIATGAKPTPTGAMKAPTAPPSGTAARPPAASGSAAQRQPAQRPPQPRSPGKPAISAKGAQSSLPQLIVRILQERKGPLTASQLAAEAQRRGFRSDSSRFSKMVGARVSDMRRKGILRHAGQGSGFVLASSSGTNWAKDGVNQAPAATKRTAIAGKVSSPVQPKRPGEQAPLRVVLTRLLAKSRRPMPVGELARQALATGYQTTSKKFPAVVGVMLADMGNVANVPGQGYRLKVR
jgi:hypothetical protein